MKKILYIDMDGVIADLDKFVNDMGLPKDAPNRQDLFDELLHTYPRSFAYLPEIPNSKEAIEKLKDVYEIYFASTPMSSLNESYSDKKIWLDKHYGEWAKKRLILTHRKDLLIGDYLVDDRTANGAGEFKGKHIHFGTPEFKNWDAVLSYLLKNAQ